MASPQPPAGVGDPDPASAGLPSAGTYPCPACGHAVLWMSRSSPYGHWRILGELRRVRHPDGRTDLVRDRVPCPDEATPTIADARVGLSVRSTMG